MMWLILTQALARATPMSMMVLRAAAAMKTREAMCLLSTRHQQKAIQRMARSRPLLLVWALATWMICFCFGPMWEECHQAKPALILTRQIQKEEFMMEYLYNTKF